MSSKKKDLETLRSNYEASRKAFKEAEDERIEEFAKMISDLSDEAYSCRLDEHFDSLIEAINYDDYIRDDGPEQYDIRKENILELKSMMATFSEENEALGLPEFLENIALYSDLDDMEETDDCVVLMTIHSAKGLEFDNVFLPAMEESIFPSRQTLFNPTELEEERRLAYVAVTRARKRLIITCSGGRMLFGNTMINKVSRFVDEIPNELINRTDMTVKRDNLDRPYYHKPTVKGTNPYQIYSSDLLKKPATKQTSEPLKLDYQVGDRVMHKAFGEGVVISLMPMASDMLVEVAFDKVGTKKIMAKFAKLEKI